MINKVVRKKGNMVRKEGGNIKQSKNFTYETKKKQQQKHISDLQIKKKHKWCPENALQNNNIVR